MTKPILSLLLLSPIALAHICMWAPMQRGKFSISTPGESACYLKEGPCGGVPAGEALTTLTAGEKFNVLFQQNLNHFYIDHPGKLVADIAYSSNPSEADFVPLSDLNDYNAMNEITQTNFSLAVRVPASTSDHAVLRLRYLSENPTENDRGTIFYQCADVKIISSTSSPSEVKEEKKEVVGEGKGEGNFDCCAAKQFTLEGYETSSWRQPTKKAYYFDQTRNLFRVDTISGAGKGTTPVDGHFQMLSNFTSGIEYYYNVQANTCDLYGLNYWSDWCYGAVNNQVHQAALKVGNELADVWAMPGDNDVFRWTNSRQGCVPLSMNRVDSSEVTYFFNYKEGAPEDSLFALPAACVRAEAQLASSEKSALPKSPRTHNMKL